jgi:phage antirepressor YoqD-like protein
LRPLPVRALYTVSALAKAIGIGNPRMKRLLLAQDLLVYQLGKSWLVPRSEVEEKLPEVWECIVRGEKRRGVQK